MSTIDPATRAALISGFAPFVWVYSGEISRPSSVSWALGQAQLYNQSNQPATDNNGNPIPPTGQALTGLMLQQYAGTSEQSGYSLYYLGQSDIVANWPSDANYVLRGQPFDANQECTAECYAHPRALQDSVAGYAITYMFFNPFNATTAGEGFVPYLGVHVGDWEHITVLVTPDGQNVVAVYFSRHGTGEWVMPQDCTFQADTVGGDATHVVVYSAGSSHASYSTPGIHPNPTWSIAAADHTDQGYAWKTWNQIIDVGELSAPTSGYEWIAYQGYWGTDRGSLGAGTSPRTPSYQSWFTQEDGEDRWQFTPHSQGPSGGFTSSPVTTPTLPAGARITGFTVWAGTVVNGLEFACEGPGAPASLYIGGSDKSPQPQSVTFAPDEYIVWISGRYGQSIDQITIGTYSPTTGSKSYGAYGGNGGQIDFIYTIPLDLTCVGFVGMAGAYLDAIGLVLDEGPPRVDMVAPVISLGPSGGQPSNDQAFDYQQIPDGASISGFTIWFGRLVNAIQLSYLDNTNTPIQLTKQGGTQSAASKSFTFASDEYIVAIQGRYGNSVDSLAIITNSPTLGSKTYGPFGGPGGDVSYYYEVPPGYDFGGFWGYANQVIDAIGLTLRASD